MNKKIFQNDFLVLIFSLAILLVLSSSSLAQSPSPSPTPSLKETMEFILGKLEPSYKIPVAGQIMTRENNWSLTGDTQLTLRSGATKYFIKLEDADISTMFIEKAIDAFEVTVFFKTGTVCFSSSCPSEKSKPVRITDGSAFSFPVRDKETADRVAKALKHAIKLAKEKEPF